MLLYERQYKQKRKHSETTSRGTLFHNTCFGFSCEFSRWTESKVLLSLEHRGLNASSALQKCHYSQAQWCNPVIPTAQKAKVE